MEYISTRGGARPQDCAGAILSGIAPDGGLFVPHPLPKNAMNPVDYLGKNYRKTALAVMSLYMPDYTEAELKQYINAAYKHSFDTTLVAPLVKQGDYYFLELFHGPTLAFKDLALTILPHFLKKAMEKKGIDKDVVVLTATSGDTGKAALEGFADVEGTKIIVFFPEHGVSLIQKRQMVTQKGKNTYVLGIEGNFDDAQKGVKEIFTDVDLLNKMASGKYVFSSANSINVGRLIPQIVYYVFAYMKLGELEGTVGNEPVNFVVPTGNFGNILAAYYAKNLGVPIKKLICSSNENRVLFDFFSTGVYDANRDFVMTMSPSMDILISSNLERLLYAISGENAETMRQLMNSLARKRKFEISSDMKAKLTDFHGGFATEGETSSSIRRVFESTGYLMDPHTAVGHAVYNKYVAETGDSTKTVIVSTASPYKFAASVMKSLGLQCEGDDFQMVKELNRVTGVNIPPQIERLEEETIRHTTVCRKEEMKHHVMEILGMV